MLSRGVDSATRFTFRRNTASLMKILVFEFEFSREEGGADQPPRFLLLVSAS